MNLQEDWDRLLGELRLDTAPVDLSSEDACDDVLRGKKEDTNPSKPSNERSEVTCDTVAISDEKEYLPTQFPLSGNGQEILYRLVCE